MVGGIGGLSGALRLISLSLLRRCPVGAPVDVRCPWAPSTHGRTKVVDAVHGMHAMHSVSIPRSVGC